MGGGGGNTAAETVDIPVTVVGDDAATDRLFGPTEEALEDADDTALEARYC